jgi:hypothetical protein
LVNETKENQMSESNASESLNKVVLTIIYNGVARPLDVQPHEKVQAVLQRAIHLFHVSQQPHLLSLFREVGTRVPDDQTVAEAGLHNGTKLLLRPDAVKGG